MKVENAGLCSRQLIFKELFVGTLIYAVTLGFFNDYTDVVDARSFSTIFLASIVLEILTYFTFLLKDMIVRRTKDYPGSAQKMLVAFCVWLLMFSSKFVFIWAIDFVFGQNITIYGFFGILWVVASVTIVHRLADKAFAALAD